MRALSPTIFAVDPRPERQAPIHPHLGPRRRVIIQPTLNHRDNPSPFALRYPGPSSEGRDPTKQTATMADEYVRLSPLSPSVDSTKATRPQTPAPGRPNAANRSPSRRYEANEPLLPLERRGGCRDQEEENLPQVLVPRYRPRCVGDPSIPPLTPSQHTYTFEQYGDMRFRHGKPRGGNKTTGPSQPTPRTRQPVPRENAPLTSPPLPTASSTLAPMSFATSCTRAPAAGSTVASSASPWA